MSLLAKEVKTRWVKRKQNKRVFMRSKTLTLVITFPSTAMAMKMEKEMQSDHMPGRIIPVPKAITSSCGLAYITAPEHEELMRNKMLEKEIRFDDIVTLML